MTTTFPHTTEVIRTEAPVRRGAEFDPATFRVTAHAIAFKNRPYIMDDLAELRKLVERGMKRYPASDYGAILDAISDVEHSEKEHPSTMEEIARQRGDESTVDHIYSGDLLNSTPQDERRRAFDRYDERATAYLNIKIWLEQAIAHSAAQAYQNAHDKVATALHHLPIIKPEALTPPGEKGGG